MIIWISGTASKLISFYSETCCPQSLQNDLLKMQSTSYHSPILNIPISSNSTSNKSPNLLWHACSFPFYSQYILVLLIFSLVRELDEPVFRPGPLFFLWPPLRSLCLLTFAPLYLSFRLQFKQRPSEIPCLPISWCPFSHPSFSRPCRL